MPEFGFTYSSLYTQTLALLSAIANNILLFLPVSFHVWTFEALVGRKATAWVVRSRQFLERAPKYRLQTGIAQARRYGPVRRESREP